MPKKKEVEDVPFELTAELGDDTAETVEGKKREIPLRSNYKRTSISKKAIDNFMNEINDFYD